MKAPLLLSLAALVLSALALASAFVSQRATEPVDAAPVAPAAASDAELRARVQALSDRLDLLALRVVREQADPVQPLEASVPAEEFEVLREEVRELLSIRDDPDWQEPLQSEAFRASVAETLGQIRQEERLEAARAKLGEQDARLEEALPKYEQWLDLDANQSLQMRQALGSRFEREAEILELWAGGAPDDVVNQHKADNKSSFYDEISAFLTDGQLETYSSGWK